MIVSSLRGPRLLARRGEIDISDVAQPRLLRRMGEFGLTSVAVSASDPILSTLSFSECVSGEVKQLKTSVNTQLQHLVP